MLGVGSINMIINWYPRMWWNITLSNQSQYYAQVQKLNVNNVTRKLHKQNSKVALSKHKKDYLSMGKTSQNIQIKLRNIQTGLGFGGLKSTKLVTYEVKIIFQSNSANIICI